jgi:RHS repeat-associated protein
VDNRVGSVAIASATTTMDYDYTGSRVKKFGPLGQTLYPFPGYEIGPDGTKTKFFRLGNELLASKQSPVSNPEKQVFYHNDHLGGVNVITDISGARVQLTEYDPWGKVSRSDGNVDPSRRFTGQELDPESGLYYYGARYYDPDLGRFISPDSIVPSVGDPQSHNRYSYTRNNPVKYTDPTGHSFLSFLGGFFGAIFKVFNIVTKYVMPAFRLAGGVLELMGGNILSGLQSIASSMSGYIKNSQFQFASQVFGFFGGGESGAGGDAQSPGVQYASAEASVVTDIGTGSDPRIDFIRFDQRTENILAGLNPDAAAAAREHLIQMSQDDLGVDVQLGGGSRTYAEQDAAYAQGRTAPGSIITNARGGQSYHNFGVAYDIKLFEPNGQYISNGSDMAYRQAGRIGAELGLTWGGSFKSLFDPSHFQLDRGIDISTMRLRFESGRDVFTGQ